MPWRPAAENIAIPTLTGMMLDRGTKALDKFAIAEQLDNVGAEISFAVGTQSLEIRAKCLNRDLPLVLGLLASELRTPAFVGRRVRQGEAAVHRLPAGIAAEHRGRARRRRFCARYFPRAIRTVRIRLRSIWPRPNPPLSMRSRRSTPSTMVRRT